MIAQAAWEYEIDLTRLHADTTAIKFAGAFANQPGDETVPRSQDTIHKAFAHYSIVHIIIYV